MHNQIQKEKNFISAILYINSADSTASLASFMKKLYETLETNFNNYEVICIDDDTPTAYLDCVRSNITSNVSTSILHMSDYQGIEVSMNAGRDLAIGDFVIEFDECIWNFPDNMVMNVYKRALQDIDIVACSDTRKHRPSSVLFYSLFNHFSDFKYPLRSDNFRILSRRSINRIHSLNRTVPYRKALYANSGLIMDNLEYTSNESTNYIRNAKMKKTMKTLASDSFLLFTNVGYRFSLSISLLMVVIMILCAVYALAIYINGIAIEGWTTTILFLSFAFFGLFTILTIVIKYLSLLLSLSFKRNRYLYSSVEKL